MNPTNNTNLPDFIRKHRILAIVTFFFILIIFIVIIWIIINSSSKNTGPEPESSPYPYFENRYLLEFSIGQTLSTDVMNDVGNIIISDEEISSAPSDNSTSNNTLNTYTITLNEESFEDLSSDKSISYKVTLDVSEDRKYILYVFTDYTMENFLAVALDRIDNNDISDHTIIYANNDEAKHNAQVLINSIQLNTPILDEKSLST